MADINALQYIDRGIKDVVGIYSTDYVNPPSLGRACGLKRYDTCHEWVHGRKFPSDKYCEMITEAFGLPKNLLKDWSRLNLMRRSYPDTFERTWGI